MEHRKGHTEGQWEWHGSDLLSVSENRRDWTVIKDGYVDNDDDASLIAAAPSLLEACELVLAIHYTNDIEISPLDKKCQKMLEAAIAKAKQ